MLSKKNNVPTQLLLTDVVRDSVLQVRPVDEAVAEEYAEHLETLPPAMVWDVEGRYLLADGWHRFRAHELAGASEIKVVLLTGTLEQAKLFVANCDIRVGLRRNRTAKRTAVLLVLGTDKGSDWSDREVARHCGVSHTFVGLLRARMVLGHDRTGSEVGNVATSRADQLVEAFPDGGSVATEFGKLLIGTAVVSRNAEPELSAAVTDIARDGNNDAPRPASKVRPRRQTDNDVVEGDAAVGLHHHQHDVAGPEEDGPQNEHGDGESGEEHDADLVLGDALLGNSGVTINDVVQQAEAFLECCADDFERREALGQLIDTLAGMLTAFEDGDTAEEGNRDFDAE
ncbi:MAG: ParB/RepB/Spo0J family partition protein [Pseudomonadota bacterium]